MAKRFPHVLRGTKRNQLPTNIVIFDTETDFTIGPDRRQYHHLKFGWACFLTRSKGNEWSAPAWFRFETITEFWDWVTDLTRKQTRLYLFAHNGAFDLPVLNAFTSLPAYGYELTSAVADAPPMILTWRMEGRSIRFVDTLNIWRLPLAKIGESIGVPKFDMPAPTDSASDWDKYGRQDVEILRVVLLRWFRFVTDNELGGFAPTLASQAFRAYRHRFMPEKILIDDHEGALKLSREAYVGGRVECFRIGEYRGTFKYVDVNSMYPAVMHEGEFPYKLIGVYGMPTRAELLKWREKYAVLARVRIRTDVPAFPVVADDRLIFPVGEFVTTLCASELDLALEWDVIVGCDQAAVYHQAPLFRGFVDFLYTERLKAKAAGDETTTWLYKIMMNSLYGKFGQRGRRFETVGECFPDEIDVWSDIDADDGTVRHMRKFGGIIQEWVDEGESTESFPAIAACICAEARSKLWDAIDRAGLENCYYCDTDSLVVNEEGFGELAELLHDDELGYWALDRTLSEIELHGPKDYRFDDVTRIKGIRKNATRVADGVYSQDHFVGFKGLLRSGSLNAPVVHPITKHLRREYLKGTVNPDGSVSPLRLDAEAGPGLGIALWE